MRNLINAVKDGVGLQDGKLLFGLEGTPLFSPTHKGQLYIFLLTEFSRKGNKVYPLALFG